MKIISILIILTILSFAGYVILYDVDLSDINVSKFIRCDKPYINLGFSCCLDQDDDKICDKDKVPVQVINQTQIITQETAGCINPIADEGNYSCIYDYIQRCENKSWRIIKSCSLYPGYKEPCANINILRDTESLAKTDCTIDCTCGNWTDKACGGSNCAADQKLQQRVCIPENCKNKEQCVNNSDCIQETIPVNGLENYPELFIKDKLFNGFVVIGADASVQDILSGMEITNSLSSEAGLVVGAAVLDKSIEDYTSLNLIVVGNPCKNRAAASLLGKSYPSCGSNMGIPENESIIQLVEQSNGKVAVIVAGYDNLRTQMASNVLAKHDQYALKGTKIKVTGTNLTDIQIG